MLHCRPGCTRMAEFLQCQNSSQRIAEQFISQKGRSSEQKQGGATEQDFNVVDVSCLGLFFLSFLHYFNVQPRSLNGQKYRRACVHVYDLKSAIKQSAWNICFNSFPLFDFVPVKTRHTGCSHTVKLESDLLGAIWK